MATIVPREYISDDVLRQLIFKPKTTYQGNKYKNQWWRKKEEEKEDEKEETQTINFFYLREKEKEVVLPYAFASQVLQRKVNSNIQYPEIKYNFTKTLYEVQKDVAEEALNYLQIKGTVILNLYTAFGKTVVGAFLGATLGKLTLVLFTSVVLIEQWRNTFKEFTDGVVWVVGEEPPPFAHIILCMNGRFGDLPKEYLKSIGTVIIDEAHDFCTPSRVECLLGTIPSYVIAMTATLERKNGMHSMIHAMCGMEVIKKISKKPFNVFKYNTGITVDIKLNRIGDPDWSALQRSIAESEERNNMALELVKLNTNYKILILTWRREHVNYMVTKLQERGETVDFMCGNKKSYSDSRILVGTIKKIGTAFDEKTACDNFNGFRLNMLILLGSMKSIALLEQVAGRVFRAEFPQIIHFVDDMKISENHWNEGQRWYKSRNGCIHNYDSPFLTKKRQEEASKPTSPVQAQLAYLNSQNQQNK